ncbi:MAG TPA: glycosyltransferase family 39 protein [Euzebyales bacterium]
MTATVEPKTTIAVPASERRTPVAWWELVAVGLAMVVVAALGVAAIRRGAPLRWDEAVYSLRALELLGATDLGQYWISVRAPGLPLMLTPMALLVGATDVAFRTTCLVLAVAGVAVTWLITRLLAGAGAAALAAWLLVLAPGWLDSSWQVMPDIPGATLTLAAMAVILLAARGDRLGWWALAAAPLAFAATLIRYGAPLLIGPAVVAALALRWPAVRARPWRAVATLVGTAVGAAVVWFIPAVTRSPRPPVLIFTDRQDAKAIPATESAADFFASLATVTGPVFGTLVVIGIVLAVVAAWRHPALRGPVVASALVTLSVLALLLVGIAEYHLRYLAPALPFLAILAAIGIADLPSWNTRPAAWVTLGVIGAVVGLAGLIHTARVTLHSVDELSRVAGNRRAAYVHIAETTERPCVMLNRSPTAGWYSGCTLKRPVSIRHGVAELAETARADDPLWMVLRRGDTSFPLRGRETDAGAHAAWLRRTAAEVTDVTPATAALRMGTVAEFDAALGQRDNTLRRLPPTGRWVPPGRS